MTFIYLLFKLGGKEMLRYQFIRGSEGELIEEGGFNHMGLDKQYMVLKVHLGSNYPGASNMITCPYGTSSRTWSKFLSITINNSCLRPLGHLVRMHRKNR